MFSSRRDDIATIEAFNNMTLPYYANCNCSGYNKDKAKGVRCVCVLVEVLVIFLMLKIFAESTG